MPTEKEIRQAIVTVVKAAAGNKAVVVGRNILGIPNNGWVGMLQSPRDAKRVHGWMVTMAGEEEPTQFLNNDEGRIRFHVWQFYEYRSGNDTSNSEDEASDERELVRNAFKAIATLPAALNGVQGLYFPVTIVKPVGEKAYHVTQGSLIVDVFDC